MWWLFLCLFIHMVRAQYSISCPDGTTALSITGCEGTLTRVLRNAPEGSCNTDFTIWVANAGAASEVGNAILTGDFIAKTLTVETDIVLPTGAIGTDVIADGAVTNAKIADGTIKSVKLENTVAITSDLTVGGMIATPGEVHAQGVRVIRGAHSGNRAHVYVGQDNNHGGGIKYWPDNCGGHQWCDSFALYRKHHGNEYPLLVSRFAHPNTPYFPASIEVQGGATIRSSAGIGGNLGVDGTATLKGKITAEQDVDVGQDLKVTRNARIQGRALFSKRVSMKGHAYGTGSHYSGETQPGVDWSDGKFDGKFHYYSKGKSGNDGNIWDNQFGLVLSHNVLAQTYHARSDERIKTDIEPVPDHLALDTIRRLDSKYYHYKDTLKFGRNRTIGFIAQEVLEAIPEAVSREIEVIPNEMRKTNPTWRARADGTFDMQIDGLTGPGVYRFFMSFNRPKLLAKKPTIYNETEHDLTTTDGKTFTTDQKYDNVFLYGKEVDDFLTIDKNKIFAIAYAALQEVDRIQQVMQEKVVTLEETVLQLSERLAALEK